MYNEDQKKRWIDEYLKEYKANKDYLINLFNKSEPQEIYWGKDLCEFNNVQIENYYKSLGFKSAMTLSTSNSQLKNYKNWCVNNNLAEDIINYFDQFNYKRLSMIVGRDKISDRIVNKDELDYYIMNLENPVDKLLLRLLYLNIFGKDGEDLFMMKLDDLSGNSLRLHSGRTVVVNDEIAGLIKKTAETYSYKRFGKPAATGYNEIPLYGEWVFKLTRDSERVLSKFRSNITRKLKKMQIMFDKEGITVINLKNSGLINKLFDMSVETGIPFKDLIWTDRIDGILKEYDYTKGRKNIVPDFSEYIDTRLG